MTKRIQRKQRNKSLQRNLKEVEDDEVKDGKGQLVNGHEYTTKKDY